LLLRGLGRSGKHWHSFPEQLKEIDLEVYSLDLPGNGELSKVESPRAISAYTDITRLKYLKIEKGDSPKILIAISLGGMVALDWLSRYPLDFDHVFVINSSAKDIIPIYKRFNLSMLKNFKTVFLASPYFKEKAILEFTLSIKKVDDDLIYSNIESEDKTTSFKNYFNQIFSASKFSLPKISDTKKLHIITSKGDKLVSYQASKNISTFYNCSIDIHPNAGHDLPLDDSKWLITVLKLYLVRTKS
jgi:pimeloyl-ACP methyl ester carboxylesterase